MPLKPTTTKRYRVKAPANWRERHLEAGWVEERDGPIPTFGINYPPERRAEEGDVVQNIPAHATGDCGPKCPYDDGHGWMVADGILEEVA